MPIDYQQAKALFLNALHGVPAADWERHMQSACPQDAELREYVADLLREHAAAEPLATQAVQSVAARVAPAALDGPGALIGPYKLLEQIGEGGMGVVYMAEQQRPVRRLVALKLVKPGMDSKQVIARFEAERQALAVMDHPNIAKILDAGTVEGSRHTPCAVAENGASLANDGTRSVPTTAGRPYFVMELVRGIPINEFCDEKRLPVRQRLELFIQVCQAVQHAHQKGIIHRDLKPTNVLVTMHDAAAVPKIIDFGIAKALTPTRSVSEGPGASIRLTEHTLHTGFAQLVGTPLYMSPEQAEMNQFGVDTRSDVYSLGVMLYELLTGATPFDKETFKDAGFDEMRRIIREEEPMRPSARLSTLAADTRSTISQRRSADPRHIALALRGELDWIVMKSLEKDRNRRYESASSLAADIQRYLADEPVQACPPSAGYRFRKFARRNKVALTTAALVGLALIIGTAGSTWQAVRATRAEARANAAKQAEAEERQRAEANFEKAWQAVDQMLTRVASQTLKDIPQMGPVRAELLDDAVKFYDGFLQEQGTNPRVRFETARAYYKVGNIQNQFDRRKESEQAWRRAIDITRGLTASYPDDARYRNHLSSCLLQLGWALQSQGRPQEAESLYLQVLAVDPKQGHVLASLASVQWQTGRLAESEATCQKALAIFSMILQTSSNLNDRLRFGQLHQLLGDLMNQTGRTDEAEKAYRQALKEFETLVADRPMDLASRRQLADVHLKLGNLLSDAGRPADAEQAFKVSLAVWEKVTSDFPDIPRHRYGLAIIRFDLGNMLRKTGRDAEAEGLYRQALEPLDTLISENPNKSEYQSLYGAALNNLSIVVRRRGEWAEAVRLVEQAIEHQQTALRLTPVASQAREDLRNHYGALAEYVANPPEGQKSDPVRAIELANKALELDPKDGNSRAILGMAQYRAGDWQAACASLQKALDLRGDGDEDGAGFLLAMAHWQMGNKPQARESYDQAVAALAKTPEQAADLRRYQTEAAALLGIPVEPPKTLYPEP